MAKRAVALLVSAGLLSGLGMPLARPCCSLAALVANVSSPDCCPMPDCCRNEKKGAAPVVLAAKSAAAHAAPAAAHPLPGFARPFAASKPAFALPEIASVHGPPTRARDLAIFLSTLRV